MFHTVWGIVEYVYILQRFLMQIALFCVLFTMFYAHYVQIKELITKCPEAVSRPLLKASLSERQWEAVTLINHALRQEYECRRQMLLQRLDVTILSFQWSDRAKVSVDKIYFLYAFVCFYVKNVKDLKFHS